MKLSIIGKTNNPWILEVLKNIPTEVEKRTIILIGPIPQIFLSPILRIFLYKVIWLGSNPRYNFLAKQVSVFADKIITPNQSIEAKYLRIGISNQKIQLIYPICSFGQSQNKIYDSLVLCCDGSLSIEDGMGTLLRGIAMAHDILGNIKLIIGGEIIEKNRIEWLASEIGLKDRIQIAPSQAHTWCAQGHIYIWLNNNNQPSPLSLIQAMSFGKAIIATDKLANHEFIKQNKNGILVKSGNAEILSQTIINLARKPDWMRELGQNNYKFAKQKFSPEVFRQKLTTLF
jgi:glycosyltransferase involved in cell wall biosynthesis